MGIYLLYVMVPRNLSSNLMVVRRHGLLKILHQQIAFLAVLPRVELQRMHIEVNFWEFMLYSRLSVI